MLKPHQVFERKSDIPNLSGSETSQFEGAESIGDDASSDEFHGSDSCDESDSLSDIDDIEVKTCLVNDKEKHYRKIIWEAMNCEFVQEQAAKEAAAAAAKAAFETNSHGQKGELQAARELDAAVAAAVAKSKKERQQKRAASIKTSHPTQTSHPAQTVNKKRPSSKINYNALEKLFDQDDPEKAKKARTTPPLNGESGVQHSSDRMAEPEYSYDKEESENGRYAGGEYGDRDGVEGYDYEGVEGYDYEGDDDDGFF